MAGLVTPLIVSPPVRIFIFRTTCGFHSSVQLRKLLKACDGIPTVAGRRFLEKVSGGPEVPPPPAPPRPLASGLVVVGQHLLQEPFPDELRALLAIEAFVWPPEPHSDGSSSD